MYLVCLNYSLIRLSWHRRVRNWIRKSLGMSPKYPHLSIHQAWRNSGLGLEET